jgi:hypothetical protein
MNDMYIWDPGFYIVDAVMCWKMKSDSHVTSVCGKTYWYDMLVIVHMCVDLVKISGSQTFKK